MKTVENFSRHPFNVDQRRALLDAGYEPEDRARAPFFKDIEDLLTQVGGKIVSAVIPGDIIWDCWARMSFGAADVSPQMGIPVNTTIIGWRTDESARRRGRFAVRGIVVHRWEQVWFPANKIGEPDCWGYVVIPQVIYEREIAPTVENDFQSGEEFPYGGQ